MHILLLKIFKTYHFGFGKSECNSHQDWKKKSTWTCLPVSQAVLCQCRTFSIA